MHVRTHTYTHNIHTHFFTHYTPLTHPTPTQAGLKALPPGFGAVFPTGQASDNETAVQERVGEVVQQLQQRAQEEITLLPFPRCALCSVL